MAAFRRPLSASSTVSRSSAVSFRSFLSSSSQSHPSSLEDVIVKEYLNKTEEPTAKVLPRNYISPYVKTSARHSKDRPCLDTSKHRPVSGPPSVCAPDKSTFQDFLTNHKASAQCTNADSDVYFKRPATTGNPSFSSQSKRNRPVSAPQGHPRYAREKHHGSGYGAVPIFQRQPWVIRATAYKNGEHTVPVKVSAPTIPLLLEQCTEKLKMNMAARCIFLSDGSEVFEPKDVPRDSDIYVSSGEPFKDPLKNVKDNTLLSEKVTWTMNGLMLPSSGKRTKQVSQALTSDTGRILVFENGNGKDGHVITAIFGKKMEEFLDLCTSKVNLGSSAKCIFDIYGEKVEDLRNIPLLDKCLQNSITYLRGPVWLSKGEGFSPTGVKIYIQGVLSALRQRLKSARSYSTQVENYMTGRTDEISRKEILSMTEEELYLALEEENELIEELKAAIEKHQRLLTRLAPQIQAEKELGAAYVYQHIKPLPRQASSPTGLHLKVFENGKDFGGIIVYISRKELQQPLQELFAIIKQKLQWSSDFTTSLGVSRLYDEQGQEIKSPQSLQNEQNVWVSCGEDFRAPVDNIICMNFDKVVWTEKEGKQFIYKTFVDPDAPPLAHHSGWHLLPKFPDGVTPMNLQVLSTSEIVEADGLFLQSKTDQQLVLHPSLIVEKRSRAPGQSGQKGKLESASSALPPCNIWLITKDGMILSKTKPQICLAVGRPVVFRSAEGAEEEGYKLTLQKRGRNKIGQLWSFSNKGAIFSTDYPDFVLTHLDELNLEEVMDQKESYSQMHNVPSPSTASSTEQLSPALDAQPLPAGGPGQARQLTVALVRILEEKQPKASAQRWAIKHEGLSKPRQWKLSKVKNPLWNKLTYLWPVLPNGDINEDLDWPIEGSLIAHSPPLQKPTYSHPESHTPMRLKVLRNGEWDQSRACVIVGPSLKNMLKKQNKQLEKKANAIKKTVRSTDTNTLTLEQIEMQQFLERCTQIMNLPAAARRLFNENGHEISYLREVERDELVYVSCGELWIDPGLSASEQKRHLLVSLLSSDVAFIRSYCGLRNPENLALEVNGDIVAGARLSVNYCAMQTTSEEQETDNGESQEEEGDIAIQESDFQEPETTHQRTHRKMDALFTDVRYSWQQPSQDVEEANDTETEENIIPIENHINRVPRKWQQLHQQQFKYVDGQIISSAVPDLVLGVTQACAGADIVLLNWNPDDLNQRWKYLRENRTFHLAGNKDLVLAVSLPKIYQGVKENEIRVIGCPVILQTYKEHVNGAANQKWSYDEDNKVLMAFYSDCLDKEITAANHTSVCTFTITSTEEISQPGYLITSPNHNEEFMTCVSCARILRPKKEMMKITAGTMFSCASGVKDSKLNALGPFWCLPVRKTNLSTAEAQNTLDYLEQALSAMRFQQSASIIAGDGLVDIRQRAVRVMAYKNGNGFKNGKLLIAGTFPELLDLCTKELELPRPASRLYTADGTPVLELPSLIAWAVKEIYEQPKEQIRSEEIGNQKKNSNQNGTASETSPAGLESIPVDEYTFLNILRQPIDVWASCGEPFVSLQAAQRSERQEKISWLQKKRAVSGHNLMKHKIRQLQARRVKYLSPPHLVSTTNPAKPVSVEGGWTEITSEEMKLKEDINNVKKHLSDIWTPHVKIHAAVANSEKALYTCPIMKRVLVYRNGGNAKQAVYAWGKSLEELLEDCTLKLSMGHQAATVLYTSDGQLVTSWNDIKKDMLVSVSAGEPFITQKTSREQVEVRANYARIRKKYGPSATDVIISTPRSLISTLNKL